MKKSQISLFLLSAMLLTFLGCAGGNQNRKKSSIPTDKNQVEKQAEFDLYTVAGDDWTETWNPELPDLTLDLRPANTRKESSQSHSSDSSASDSTLKNPIRELQGYRIQLGNVSVADEALRVKEAALAIFDSVYIHYQSPSYKVRAGDFTSRSQADALLDSARVIFPGAWVVPSRVYDLPPSEHQTD
ncbi:SPOR domain-containing protein [bacterium]|nr:SPOR domain-containing protein [bacterium]